MFGCYTHIFIFHKIKFFLRNAWIYTKGVSHTIDTNNLINPDFFCVFNLRNIFLLHNY